MPFRFVLRRISFCTKSYRLAHRTMRTSRACFATGMRSLIMLTWTRESRNLLMLWAARPASAQESGSRASGNHFFVTTGGRAVQPGLRCLIALSFCGFNERLLANLSAAIRILRGRFKQIIRQALQRSSSLMRTISCSFRSGIEEIGVHCLKTTLSPHYLNFLANTHPKVESKS